jgi:pimeloyl-ACP methyl ester carboxylesterase
MIFDAPFSSVYASAGDGLRLHARDYGSPGDAVPVVCLPGLTRTAADFHELASGLSSRSERPRRVLAVDYRGRGLSDRDPDPTHYDVRMENADLLALFAAIGISRAAFIGTSRGGIHVMALAALRPGLIAAAVLNDIGPVVPVEGLLRIKSYVGRMTPPRDFAAAAAELADIGEGFEAFSADDWMRLAQRSYEERDGALVPIYDPALARALDAISKDQPVPELWDLFDRLAGIPLLVVRGENSDILLPDTLAAMQARRPDLEVLAVPGQAHAPPLWEEPVIERIADFLDFAEQRTVEKG